MPSRPSAGPILEPGDIAPLLELPDSSGTLASTIDFAVCGKPVVLIFHAGPPTPPVLDELRAFRRVYESLAALGATVFAITTNTVEANRQLQNAHKLPFRLLADPTRKAFQAYGLDPDRTADTVTTFVLGPNLHLARIFRPASASRIADQVLPYLQAAAQSRPALRLGPHPPVLIVPMSLSPNDCGQLLEVWRRLDAAETAVPERSTQSEGSRRFLRDYGKAKQYPVKDPLLIQYLDARLRRRVLPELKKSFQTTVSRREDYRIASYDSSEGGNLPPHRDNVSRDNQHRRFTLSVILNGGAYRGGELRFREYGEQLYDLETGTAIVWSASLLHEVMPVTSGCRFTLVTHLFDVWDKPPARR